MLYYINIVINSDIKVIDVAFMCGILYDVNDQAVFLSIF